MFTDIEGSTQLLDDLGPENYRDALTNHQLAIRDAFGRHDGYEVDTAGDGFFYAFPTAVGAAYAVGEALEALGRGPVKIRVGIHTGEPIVEGPKYVGLDVHRAARIMAAAHGRQALLSGTTRDLLDESFAVRDLGEHRLKDLSALQRLYQLGTGDFPRPRTLTLTNLPVPATEFLGRDRELAEVVEQLRDGVRLLTLTGPGGTGKTRLALQAAAEAADDFAEGVWWVPLAAVRDPGIVLRHTAQTLDVVEQSDRSLGEVLGEMLGGKRMLLVLDNVEHLLPDAVDAIATLRDLGSPKIVVTSRERLQLAGERVYPVPQLSPSEGVDLFVARAGAIDPAFEADAAVAELCSRLDNLPLAIELAAARTAVLQPEQILERLGRQLDLLTGGRDADPRQQTLRATIAWSYDLLTLKERELFASFAVFAGGATLDAVTEVCYADLDTLQSLVDKSLLRHSGDRFWMLETIREYGREVLEQGGESDAIRDHHVSFFLEFLERAEPELTRPDQRRWYAQLTLEQNNIREALAYACEQRDGERALMLAGTVWRYWWSHGVIDEAERWYARAFAIDGKASITARARGMFGLAHMTESRGDREHAREQFEEAAALLQQSGQTRLQISAMAHLVSANHLLGDRQRAQAAAEEGLALALATGDVRGAAVIRSNLAATLLREEDDRGATRAYEQALEEWRAAGDVYGIARTLTALAGIALRGGDPGQAASNVVESLELSSSIGDAQNITWELSVAAEIAAAQGDPQASARLCAAYEALRRHRGLSRPDEAETIRAAHNILGDEFDAAWADGAKLDLEAAVEFAIRVLRQESPAPPELPHAELTP